MAKANKDFQTADAIRDQLKEMGVEIMDSAGMAPHGNLYKKHIII